MIQPKAQPSASRVIQRAGADNDTARNRTYKLVQLCTALLDIGKANDGRLQEVQALYYGADDDNLSLKISVNPGQLDYLTGGLGAFPAMRRAYRTAVANEQNYIASEAWKKAVKHTFDVVGVTYTNTRYDTVDNAKFISGDYHAEQNLVEWIGSSSRLEGKTRVYIAGSKLPCSQCRPVLQAFDARLPDARPNVRFYFRDETGDATNVDQLVVANLTM
ncbi:hypothetical protein [Polyangium mundeleinium]|uniref:CMP/dCMP-type deaminase domain-containing protein n=1 Tax=Polyangium mundeleinium TaxID=2995306 RepID=A0ABT5EMM1_9BACT|nr:hypothetical protein [Polyangium mundeleinium]MDC0743068.1 hypothetical protein [Polyangium mundeleinium]